MRVLIFFVALCSCVTQSADEAFRERGLSRAVFDLRCPAEELDVYVLANATPGLACIGAQVGVRGCGRQAVYVCDRNARWRAEATPEAL